MTTELPTAQRLAQALANTTRVPTYVVRQGGRFLIQDDDDLSVYFASVEPVAIVATYQPACDPPDGPPAIGDGPGEDNPPPDNRFPICRACHTGIYPASSMQPAFCIECVNAMLHGLDNRFSAAQFAQTRQSIAIEAKLAVCRNCGGIHHIQRCPELTRALCTPEPPPWHDAELGKELCWMVWHRYQAFITLLHSVPSNQLIIYAASYQAFMRSHSPASDLTITQILEKWNRWMRGDRGAVIRQVAA